MPEVVIDGVRLIAEARTQVSGAYPLRHDFA